MSSSGSRHRALRSSPPNSAGQVDRSNRRSMPHSDPMSATSSHSASVAATTNPSNYSPPIALEDDAEFDKACIKFLKIKNQPFAVSGRVSLDMRDLSIFFRTQNGKSHSIDFPLDLEQGSTPAFDTLLHTCQVFTSSLQDAEEELPPARFNTNQYTASTLKSTKRRDSANKGPYVYPPNLSLSTTLELSNYPVLDTVRDVLFPHLPAGHYLVAQRASLEVAMPGAKSRALLPEENPPDRVATLLVTLPIRFRGGALVITHPNDAVGVEEKFHGRGGRPGDLEWTAFLADCHYGLEDLNGGCKMTLSYNILLKTLGPTLTTYQPLMMPNDRFLDAMTPLFARAKGRKLGFFLSGNYPLSPTDVTADTVVAQLKGSDAILYHAATLYKLNVEFRYTAGGYIWSQDQIIQLVPTTDEPLSSPASSSSPEQSERSINFHRRRAMSITMSNKPSVGGPTATRTSSEDSDERGVRVVEHDGQQSVKTQVQASGALTLRDARVFALTALSRNAQGPVTRLPVSFMSNASLNRLWVNVLMVVWTS